MVDVSWRTARPGGVTLVAICLDNRVEAPGVPAHRVRLVPTVDGPVWPPRVEGVQAAPWTVPDDGEDDALEGGAAAEVVVPTGRVGSLGFASDAPAPEPPVEVAEVGPADADEGADPTAADVLRVLGDPAPPRDVVAPDGPTGRSGQRPSASETPPGERR